MPINTSPAFDAGYDGSEIPNPRYSLDPAGELAADIALVYKIAPSDNSPRAASWAMREAVPVPQGERSMAASP